MDSFGDYDLDGHPFNALGGYDRARRVFGGEEALGEVLARFNAAVFDRTSAVGPSAAAL